MALRLTWSNHEPCSSYIFSYTLAHINGYKMNGSYSISCAIPRCKRESKTNTGAVRSGIIEARKVTKKMDKRAQARRYEARKDVGSAIFKMK